LAKKNKKAIQHFPVRIEDGLLLAGDNMENGKPDDNLAMMIADLSAHHLAKRMHPVGTSTGNPQTFLIWFKHPLQSILSLPFLRESRSAARAKIPPPILVKTRKMGVTLVSIGRRKVNNALCFSLLDCSCTQQWQQRRGNRFFLIGL
jgi:hypothetical protein